MLSVLVIIDAIKDELVVKLGLDKHTSVISNSSDKVVLKYYIYMGTMSHGFIMPILTEYVLARGYSLSQIGILEAVFMLGLVLGEIPTGYIGDRIGRRNSLLLGSVLTLVSITAIGFTSSITIILISYIIWAFGITFRSGTGDAWLYEILNQRLNEDEFSRINGRGRSAWLGITALTAVVGSYLATIGWKYPFIANSILLSGSVLAAFSLPKSKTRYTRTGDYLRISNITDLIKNEFSRRELRSFIAYIALFYGFVAVVGTFTQPISTSLGVPIEGLGWLYAIFNLLAAIISYFAGDIKERIGIRLWFLIFPILVVGIFAFCLVIPILALPMLIIIRMVDKVSRSLQNQYINNNITSVGRATVLSAVSMVSAVFGVLFRLIGGFIANATSPVIMLGGFGVILMILFMIIQMTYSPVVYAK